IVVDPSLPQGPTPLMAIRRGRARHTFHMTWDARLRWALPWRDSVHSVLALDVFNLWGSATELLEDPRTAPAPYRRSVEAVPARAVLVSLELAYQ
ncbi:MAG TPA: hypothetical protein VFH51_16670, partial [Myxococcota bacterium]|nr:hypothetical protein [Myxococcota bacterium]